MLYPSYEWVDVVGIALTVWKVVFALTCLAFFVSGLDDLFIDICYLGRGIYHAFKRETSPQLPPESELISAPEQPIAVMLPAWDESAVIRPMLINAAKTVNYRNVHFFVGTYPNDPDTYREAKAAKSSFRNIHLIVTGNDGPTNKADCLNWIYHGIKKYEARRGIQFQIFVMQDCEDVIHPLCYKVFNAAIPQTDMVQLPVHSLRRRWSELTGGHYLDEFAQLHTKDLVIREMLTGSIPGAGVGLAFSRRALETVARHNANEVFSTNSLTEDYDFGFRMKEHGLRQSFIRYWVQRGAAGRRGWLRPKPKRELVCIKEFFPGDFYPSIKQKSRWIVGIVFQGWAHIGWPRGIATKYFLLRDRKAVLTNFVNLLGYVVVCVIALETANNTLLPDGYRFPPLVESGGLLWYLVLANGLLVAERVIMRMYCVYGLHGLGQALLSVPRMVWGNFINFFATWRAVTLYLRYLKTGKLIAWDKTAHVYPTDAELGALRPRLGDLLIARQLITAKQLHLALEQQAARHRPLGKILVEMRAVNEDELEATLQAA